jgi:hypothetical protein
MSAAEVSSSDAQDYVAAQMKTQLSKCNIADAWLCSLRKAHKKRYPVFNGDPGFCHLLTATALGLRDTRCGADISLYVSAGGQEESLCFQVNRSVIQSSALGRGLLISQPNDQCLQLQLVHSFRKPLISCQGLYKLVVHNKDEGIGAVIQAQGAYDLGQFPLDKAYHLLRLPLHSSRHLNVIVEKQLPCHELHIVCKQSRKHPGCYKVRSVHLQVHLRPSPQWLLEQRPCIPVGPRRMPLQPSPLCTQFQDEAERRLVEPTNTIGALSGALERQLQLLLGKQAVFRLVSYVGSSQICQAGSGDFHYHLSSASEPLTAAAIINYVQQRAPKEWPLVDLHDPALLKHFLTEAGAGEVAVGLQEAYAYHGHGRMPSIYELLTHVSGLPEHASFAADPARVILGQEAAPEQLGLGAQLSKHCVPLFTPGSKYHHSHLGYRVLMNLFPTQDAFQQTVQQCLVDLGAPTAGYDHSKVRLAPPCPTSCAQGLQFQDPCAGEYDASSGLVARIDELALVLSEK